MARTLMKPENVASFSNHSLSEAYSPVYFLQLI